MPSQLRRKKTRSGVQRRGMLKGDDVHVCVKKTFPQLSFAILGRFAPSEIPGDEKETEIREKKFAYFFYLIWNFLIEGNLTLGLFGMEFLLTFWLGFLMSSDYVENPGDTFMLKVWHFYTPIREKIEVIFDDNPTKDDRGVIIDFGGILAVPFVWFMLYKIRNTAYAYAENLPPGMPGRLASCIKCQMRWIDCIILCLSASIALPKLLRFFLRCFSLGDDYFGAVTYECLNVIFKKCYDVMLVILVPYHRGLIRQHRLKVGAYFAKQFCVEGKRWQSYIKLTIVGESIVFLFLLVVVRINLFTLTILALYNPMAAGLERIINFYPE